MCHFPEYITTYEVLFWNMGSIYYWNSIKIITAIFKKVTCFVFQGPCKRQAFYELECSHLAGTLNTEYKSHPFTCPGATDRQMAFQKSFLCTQSVSQSNSPDQLLHDHNAFLIYTTYMTKYKVVFLMLNLAPCHEGTWWSEGIAPCIHDNTWRRTGVSFTNLWLYPCGNNLDTH